MEIRPIIASCIFYIAFSGGAAANAAISSLYCENGGGPALTISGMSATPESGTLCIKGVQSGALGQMRGSIGTDTPADPTITITSEINNETTSPWIGYRVIVSMDAPFSLSAASVTAPSGWTATVNSVTGSTYTEQIDYLGGTPVWIGDSLNFSYQMQFSGATTYGFAVEMTPIYATAPEPAAFGVLSAILAFGAFALRKRLSPRP